MDLVEILRSLPLFASLSHSELAPLASEARLQRLGSGDLLYQAGDIADEFHLLVHGRLQVMANGQALGQVSRGEPIGEMSVISGENRKADVRALRDSVVLALPAATLTAFLTAHPDSHWQMTRLIIERARKSAVQVQRAKRGCQNIALIAASPGLPLLRVAEQWVRHLPAWPSTRLVTSAQVDTLFGSNAAQTATDHGDDDLAISRWFAELEGHHAHLVFAAQQVDEPWLLRCLRQADRILVLASAHEEPHLNAALQALQSQQRLAPVELVLLRPEGDSSPYTSVWCKATQARAHYYVRAGSNDDLAALARQTTGRGIGLVLGGGGARGFAHIGLVRAMEQLQIHADVVGGTSMGAFVAAMIACDFDSVEMTYIARETFVNHNYLNDYTLPRVSLIRGQRFHGRLQAIFGDRRIEELRRTFYCISTNLSTGFPMVHDQGGLATWVGTSMSVPGVAPPIAFEGDLLCDGGIVNNLPTDVMQHLERGVIIACNVSNNGDIRAPGAGLGEPDQLALLNWKSDTRAPTLTEILMRTATLTSDTVTQQASIERADTYIRMPIEDIGMFDWQRLDELIERGYEHALTLLAPIRENLLR